jgi:hypothetical protein
MSNSERALKSYVSTMPTNMPDRDILREKWRMAAIAFEKADDAYQRAKEGKAIFFDALVETLMDQAEKAGTKLLQGKAERVARTSDAYKAELDKTFDLRLTARLLAIEEKNADRLYWEQVSAEARERQEMRMTR